MTAEEARELSRKSKSMKLDRILTQIKKEAESEHGSNRIFLKESIDYALIKVLKELGYVVIVASPIAVQKDDWYYCISW